MILKKNMRLGNRIYQILIFCFIIDLSYAEEKIVTTPLLNLNEIKPSFELLDEENENISSSQNLKEKKKYKSKVITSDINRT